MLRVKRVQPRTICLYSDHVQSFVEWAGLFKLSLLGDRKVDITMSKYFLALFEDGEAMNAASYTLFGWICLKMTPTQPERDLLPLSRAALTAWRGMKPSCARVGVPPEVIYHFTDLCIGREEIQVATIALIQYDLYARPSEVLQLKGRDFVPPVPSLASHWGVIFGNSEYAERTKAGKTDDVVLADSQHRAWAERLLRHVSRGRLGKDEPVFTVNLAHYESVCRAFSQQFKLKTGIFSPHVLRHSGPSFDAIHGLRSLPDIQSRGRWASNMSVQRYRKPGRLLMQASQLPASLKASPRRNLCDLLNIILSSPWVQVAPLTLVTV